MMDLEDVPDNGKEAGIDLCRAVLYSVEVGKSERGGKGYPVDAL